MAQLSPLAGPSPANLVSFFRAGAGLWRRIQALARGPAPPLALIIPIGLVVLAALGPLMSNRLHRDEAIYSSWGLDIASGRDILVSGSAVDKPPLFLYVQALSFLLFGSSEVAARLPSLVATVVSVGLIFELGRSLYSRDLGLLAALLWAASPFTILFAPTAFTDPMMVMWMLAGCAAAVHGRWAWAGIWLGLAAITKPQGAFFAPLALGLGQVAQGKSPRRASQAVLLVAAFLSVFGLALLWDVARARQPGFLAQAVVNYGRLPLSWSTAWQHWLGLVSLLRYGTASRVLNGALLVGLPLLLAADVVLLRDPAKASDTRFGQAGKPYQAQADLVITVFIALFLVGHSLVVFAMWDRYLLGLIPWLALLLARILTLPLRLPQNWSPGRVLGLVFVLGMLAFTLRPIRDAAASRFPIGGDHGAYQGIEQIVNFFQAVPADTTVYHRWLGWHWRFYLWGSPYDFRAWTSPGDLAAQAAARPGARRYVVFPSWQSSSEARLALADAGLAMREVQRAYRGDGSVSFILYRIEEAL